MDYPLLSEIKEGETSNVTLGGLVLQYFNGKIPASDIIALIREIIHPISPESEADIYAALIDCAVEWYTVPDSAQPEVVAHTVRTIISLC